MNALSSIPSLVKIQLVVAAVAVGITIWTAVKLPPLISEKQSLEELIEQKTLSIDLFEEQLNQKQTELESLLQAVKVAQAELHSIQEQMEKLTLNLTAKTLTSNTTALQAVEQINSSIVKTGAGLSSAEQDTKKEKYNGYSVDIFYCDDATSTNKNNARAIAALGNTETRGRWRIRRLTPETNARTGYNIHSDLLRYNPQEKTIADTLIRDIAERFKIAIRGQEINYPTPNYVSIFFCSAK